jgi:hypothetical protein
MSATVASHCRVWMSQIQLWIYLRNICLQQYLRIVGCACHKYNSNLISATHVCNSSFALSVVNVTNTTLIWSQQCMSDKSFWINNSSLSQLLFRHAYIHRRVCITIMNGLMFVNCNIYWLNIDEKRVMWGVTYSIILRRSSGLQPFCFIQCQRRKYYVIRWCARFHDLGATSKNTSAEAKRR